MAVSIPSITPGVLDPNGKIINNVYRYMKSGNGTVVTAGTPVRLSVTSQEAKVIDIINPTTNADILVIGDSTVNHSPLKGIPIQPGFSYRLQITDISNVWVDAAANGYTFSYNYFY
jgi:hypothetical protein